MQNRHMAVPNPTPSIMITGRRGKQGQKVKIRKRKRMDRREKGQS